MSLPLQAVKDSSSALHAFSCTKSAFLSETSESSKIRQDIWSRQLNKTSAVSTMEQFCNAKQASLWTAKPLTVNALSELSLKDNTYSERDHGSQPTTISHLD